MYKDIPQDCQDIILQTIFRLNELIKQDMIILDETLKELILEPLNDFMDSKGGPRTD